MGWRTVAKKDYREAMNSRLVTWLLALILFAFLMGGYVLPFEFLNSPTQLTVADYPGYVLSAATLLLPLLGILLGYDAIVTERRSGQLAILLSLPHSRRDVVVGKLAGRCLVLAYAVVLGTVLGGALVVYPYGTMELAAFVPYVLLTFLAAFAAGLAFARPSWTVGRRLGAVLGLAAGWVVVHVLLGSTELVEFVGYVLLTFLFAFAFVGIALAISAWTTSRGLAMGTAFGVFVLSAVLWQPLRTLLVLAFTRLGVSDGELPEWAAFVYGAEPGQVYSRIVRGVYDGSGPAAAADAPWYMGEWVAVGLLLLWVVGPLGLGYLRFTRTDL